VVPPVPKASIAVLSVSRFLVKGTISALGEQVFAMLPAFSFQVGSQAPAPGPSELRPPAPEPSLSMDAGQHVHPRKLQRSAPPLKPWVVSQP